jgi:type VI protein secretion system component VasA
LRTRLALQKQIHGISSITSQRHFARLVSENGISFACGLKIDVELDEEQFVGAGAYLFASVMDRFLALDVTMNSFSQLTVRTRQRKEVLAHGLREPATRSFSRAAAARGAAPLPSRHGAAAAAAG